jgi:hypothetical protein
MALILGLAEGDKFAILAVTNASSSLAAGATLVDGTAVAKSIPAEMVDEFWQESLGSIAVEALRLCNLVFVRRAPSANPELLDSEYEELREQVVQVFWLLQLSGVPYYEGAAVLKGSVVGNRINVRAHEDLSAHQFRAANGAEDPKVTLDRLAEAAQQAVTWRNLLALAQEYSRFKKGLNVLLDGLQESVGQERLHASVRALEALILPAIGQTRKQFADRCQALATASATSGEVLRECFDMRSEVEHMNEPTGCLSSYHSEQREAIALRRVRQIEALARFSYSKLLRSATLLQYFRSDSELDAFWKRPEAERKALWGNDLDLDSVL